MVRQKLAEHGFNPPGLTTVQGWARRESCPGPWMVAILLVAQRGGILVDLERLRA